MELEPPLTIATAIRPSDLARFAARLRAVLGLSTEDLAGVIGVDPRTITRAETWSGPVLSVLQLLASVRASEAGDALARLTSLHALRRADPADPSILASLRDSVQAAIDEVRGLGPDAGLAEACSAPVSWIYWATSARAGRDATRQLADEGLIVRPLLQRGTRGQSELHGYLLALQPGDSILLCHDAHPVAWYRMEAHVDPQLARVARDQLRRTESPDRIELVEALPAVFRAIEGSSVVGRRLGSLGYKLLDNTEPAGPPRSGWFSALTVRPDPDTSLPTPQEFSRRQPGERARITRFRRTPPPQP